MPQTPVRKADGHILRNFLDNRGLPVGLRVLKSPIVAFDHGHAGVHPEALKYPENSSFCYFFYPGDVAPSKIGFLDIFYHKIQDAGHHIVNQLHTQPASLLLLYV